MIKFKLGSKTYRIVQTTTASRTLLYKVQARDWFRWNGSAESDNFNDAVEYIGECWKRSKLTLWKNQQ